MFYKTGIDITNDKQMFNFLKNHFEYYTMNSWNGVKSIANKVKLYDLGLSGDWAVTLSLLEAGEYDTINMLLLDWARENRGYEVVFGGRSGGYLILCNTDNNGTILPYVIDHADTYEEYKEYCRRYYGSVKANRDCLVYYVTLVRSFDKLCDELRDYCDMLSQQSFEIMEMQKAVDEFNDIYSEDLEYLDFQCLKMDADGCVDVSEICQLNCLYEAFLRVADRNNAGYRIEALPDWRIHYKHM
jgi:hypothetical protein